MVLTLNKLYWPSHKMLVLIASARRESLDKPAHRHILVRFFAYHKHKVLGCIAQSVTCLAADTCLTADMCLTADPGVASSIPTQSHTFVEIDHEIISTVILLPSADSRRIVVSYKRKYVHEVLVNCLVKLAQEKSVVRLTDCSNMTIAVDWDVKNQTNPHPPPPPPKKKKCM